MNWSRLMLMAALGLSGCVPSNQTRSSSGLLHPNSATFFVATNGNDQWSGRLPSPNARRTDGPFGSVPRAFSAVREQVRFTGRTNSEPAVTDPGAVGPSRITIRAGTYFLTEPLVIKPEDSGFVMETYPGESPILSGGRPIRGWKQIAGKNLWAADIPQVREGKWIF